MNQKLDPNIVKLLVPMQESLEEIRDRLTQGVSTLRVIAQFVRDHADKGFITPEVSHHEVSASIDVANNYIDSATEDLDRIILGRALEIAKVRKAQEVSP